MADRIVRVSEEALARSIHENMEPLRQFDKLIDGRVFCRCRSYAELHLNRAIKFYGATVVIEPEPTVPSDLQSLAAGEVCPRCEGEGRLWADGQAHFYDASRPTKACLGCDGTGRIYDIDAMRKALVDHVCSTVKRSDVLSQVETDAIMLGTGFLRRTEEGELQRALPCAAVADEGADRALPELGDLGPVERERDPRPVRLLEDEARELGRTVAGNGSRLQVLDDADDRLRLHRSPHVLRARVGAGATHPDRPGASSRGPRTTPARLRPRSPRTCRA